VISLIKENKMIEVYVTYSTTNETWDVMSMDNKCLFYGDVWEVEQWLIDNKSTHTEAL
jgi:hypothetical protein